MPPQDVWKFTPVFYRKKINIDRVKGNWIEWLTCMRPDRRPMAVIQSSGRGSHLLERMTVLLICLPSWNMMVMDGLYWDKYRNPLGTESGPASGCSAVLPIRILVPVHRPATIYWPRICVCVRARELEKGVGRGILPSLPIPTEYPRSYC